MRTHRFTVSRTRVARIGLEEYVRSLWWVILPVPAFGLLVLLFGRGLLQVVGLLAALWPLTLAARAWFATSRSGRLYEKGVWVSLEDSTLYFHPDEGKGVRLRLESVREIVLRNGFLIFRLRRLGFLLVPVSAFESPNDADRFLATVRQQLESVPR